MTAFNFDPLMILLPILAGAALAVVALGRSRAAGVVGVVAAAVAVVIAADVALEIAAAGSFRYLAAGGWVGARAIADVVPHGMRPLVPLAVDPLGAPLLFTVTLVGLVGVVGLAGRVVHDGPAPMSAALLLLGGVVAVVIVDDLHHLVAAAAVATTVASLAPLTVAQGPHEGRAALRAFALQRVGDAALLGMLAALSASLGEASFQAIFAGAPALEPWARVQGAGGLLDGVPHRTLWFWAAIGAVVGVAARTGLACWPILRELTASSSMPPPLAGLIHGLGLQGVGMVLLVRLHPVLGLCPEAQDGLVLVGAATVLVAGILALAARDLLRADVLLLAGGAGGVAVLAGCQDIDGVVLGGMALTAVGLGLPWSAAAVVAATGERDPLSLGGLEPRMPRLHSTRLLLVAGLGLPPLFGWVLWERALEATVLSTRVPAIVVVCVGGGAMLLGLAGWRLLHRVFSGSPVETTGARVPQDPPAAEWLPVLLLAFVLPGLALLTIPRGLLLLIADGVTYDAPLAAFVAPALQESLPVRRLFAAVQAAPPVSPSTFVALALGLGFVPMLASFVFFRGSRAGRGPPGARLLAHPAVVAVAAFAARQAGRDAGVVRTMSGGVEALSRLLALNLVPAALTLLLQRLPAALASLAALLLRGTQTGALPHAIVLALALAAWIAWRASIGG